jgi:dolichyl-phosphate-mannose--protein O-mannosyl transferase
MIPDCAILALPDHKLGWLLEKPMSRRAYILCLVAAILLAPLSLLLLMDDWIIYRLLHSSLAIPLTALLFDLCDYFPMLLWLGSLALLIILLLNGRGVLGRYAWMAVRLILLLVLLLKHIDENYRNGKRFTWIFVGICIAAFIAFYPVISGTPVPAGYIPFIRWLPSWPFY